MATRSLPKSLAETKGISRDLAKKLISTGVHRASNEHGEKALAAAAGCDVATIQNIKAGKTLPEVHFLANLLAVEPTVMWELFSELGFKVVPLDFAMSPDMKMAREMSHALTTLIHSLEDGFRDHRETQVIAPLFRKLIPMMASVVAEADKHRVGERA